MSTRASTIFALASICVSLGPIGCQGPPVPNNGTDVVPIVLFNNHNSSGVHNGPTSPTQFSTTRRLRITSIETYHWNDGVGTTTVGMVGLNDASSAQLGTWTCTGRAGQGDVPNAYWTCLPNLEIPAGTYTVVDSAPETWSCNTASGEAGMCIVMGVPLEDKDDALPDGTSDTPFVVAKRYFDAQMDGDAQGMLDECALHLMSEEDIADARSVIDAVANRATLSGISFEYLATGYDAERSLALIRCQHEVKVTVDGFSEQQIGGTLFWMVWHDGRWKIRNIFPDELLALALAEEQGLLAKTTHRANRIYTWQEVNENFNKELMDATIDSGKLALDVKASAIGAKPITGDALSWWYTVGDMVVTAKAIADDAQKGRAKSVFIGTTSFAWGFVQLVAEPFPGVDHASDAVGSLLGQIHNWYQQKESYLNMLSSLKYGDFSDGDAFLLLRPPHAYPAGVAFEHHPHWLGPGIAVEGITFLTDEAYRSGRSLEFDMGTLIAVERSTLPTYYDRAVFMGAHVSGVAPNEVAYLGARITDLIIEDERSGADILVPTEIGPLGAAYNVKAMRGFQTLSVKARGKVVLSTVVTEPVTVENRVFNLVDGIAIGQTRGSATTMLELEVGETLSGLNIYGTYSQLVDAFDVEPPRMTALDPSSLTMENQAVASFAPEESLPNLTLSVTGHEPGTTYLALHVPTGHAEVRSLDASVRIEVSEEEYATTSYLPLLKNAEYISVELTFNTPPTSIKQECEHPDLENQSFTDTFFIPPHWELRGQPVWSQNTFSLTDPQQPGKTLSGTVSDDGQTILTVTGTWFTSGSEYTLNANNLPMDQNRIPLSTNRGDAHFYVGLPCHDGRESAEGHGHLTGHEAQSIHSDCAVEELGAVEWSDACIEVQFTTGT